MTKVKRFMWVRAPGRKLLHIKDGTSSEGPARCGMFVRKGWAIVNYQMLEDEDRQPCKRCESREDSPQ
jgi:hypothetical protein